MVTGDMNELGSSTLMATDPTTAYFDDVVLRAVDAPVVPREPWLEAAPNQCHANAESFVRRFFGYVVVRGWLVSGGHWLIPHSVVRQGASGRLVDITPDPSGSALPFVEHRGSGADFATLRQGRNGGWLHPPPCSARSSPTW
jgi:hypothetical protein